MKDKTKFSIVGCGFISKRHAEHISHIGELTAVCDIKKENADEMADQYKCKAYYDIDVLLQNENKVSVVSICTPNGLHASQTIKALAAGKHVLCEKPMALSTNDCKAMIQAQEEAGKHLFIVKQNRFNPPVIAVKKAIDENKLGRIVNIQLNCFWSRNADYYQKSDWKGRKDLDGGILFTQFSHFIDLLLWMIGDIKYIQCLTKNFLHQGTIEFEDTGVVIVEFISGAVGTINFTINSYRNNFEGSITIFGEKGTVKIGGQYLNILEYQNIENYTISDLPAARPANDYGYYQGSMSNHDLVYQNIIEVLDHKAQITTNSLEGLKTVEIIEKIYAQASKSKKG